MIRKIELNKPLKAVPRNGLVRFAGVFYRRCASRSGRIFLRCVDGCFFDISVPCNTIVQYYVEDGK